jgi:hypothetical protein
VFGSEVREGKAVGEEEEGEEEEEEKSFTFLE